MEPSTPKQFDERKKRSRHFIVLNVTSAQLVDDVHGHRDDGSAESDWGRVFDRIEAEIAIEAAGTKTFERLYHLVEKGYRADLNQKFSGAIWLQHPK